MNIRVIVGVLAVTTGVTLFTRQCRGWAQP